MQIEKPISDLQKLHQSYPDRISRVLNLLGDGDGASGVSKGIHRYQRERFTGFSGMFFPLFLREGHVGQSTELEAWVSATTRH